jgi:HupE / UreJ protein
MSAWTTTTEATNEGRAPGVGRVHIPRVRPLTFLAVAALLGPTGANAHPVGLSRSELALSGPSVHASVRGSAREFGLGRGAPSETGRGIAASLGRIVIRQGDVRCPLSPGPLSWEPPDGFVAEGVFRCPRPIERIDVELAFLADLPHGHSHLAHVTGAGDDEERVVRAGATAFTIERPPSGWRRAAAFVALGVEHILGGYDHLAFLLAVLLVVPSLRLLIRIVTSFTVAHSITLAAAAAGLVSVRPRLVEPLIAASVLAVACENLWLLRSAASSRAREQALRRRWALTFAFGLVHGLGLAGALGALQLSGRALASALVSFNLGVELGQVAVATVLVPVILTLRRGRLAVRVSRIGSAGVALAGAVWLAARLAAGG